MGLVENACMWRHPRSPCRLPFYHKPTGIFLFVAVRNHRATACSVWAYYVGTAGYIANNKTHAQVSNIFVVHLDISPGSVNSPPSPLPSHLIAYSPFLCQPFWALRKDAPRTAGQRLPTIQAGHRFCGILARVHCQNLWLPCRSTFVQIMGPYSVQAQVCSYQG